MTKEIFGIFIETRNVDEAAIEACQRFDNGLIDANELGRLLLNCGKIREVGPGVYRAVESRYGRYAEIINRI